MHQVEDELGNKQLITWFIGQYCELLHSCMSITLAFGSGNTSHNRAIKVPDIPRNGTVLKYYCSDTQTSMRQSMNMCMSSKLFTCS